LRTLRRQVDGSVIDSFVCAGLFDEFVIPCGRAYDNFTRLANDITSDLNGI